MEAKPTYQSQNDKSDLNRTTNDLMDPNRMIELGIFTPNRSIQVISCILRRGYACCMHLLDVCGGK